MGFISFNRSSTTIELASFQFSSDIPRIVDIHWHFVAFDDRVESSLQLQFQTEKLSRTIQECSDIETLRAIAIELLKLHEKQSAMAQWATKRGIEAEHRALIREMGLKENLEE